jgi:2-polyprenyl-6-hydroxyphenyl methylase/3-demethylubiquinone-9 3-methyltransferase
MSASAHEGPSPQAQPEAEPPAGASIDPAEVAQFERLGEEWWSDAGPMAALHRINPIRLRWMRDAMIDAFPTPDGGRRDPAGMRALDGLSILDAGCGGGLLTEPLARMGADALGIDPAPGNVEIARAHAAQTGVTARYRAASVEELRAEHARFDVVCAMEVIEHVRDPAQFIDDAAALVKPGGLFFCSTLNRTLKSFALAIVGAEYVLRWVAPGTHNWSKFVTPEELEDWIKAAGLDLYALAGVSYAPLAREWSVSRDLDVNYMVVARRPLRLV